MVSRLIQPPMYSEFLGIFLAGMAAGALLVVVGQVVYRQVYKWLDHQQAAGAIDRGELPDTWVKLMDDFQDSEAWVESELKASERQRWEDSE